MDRVGQLPSGDRIALGGAAGDIVWLSTSTRSIIVVRSPRTCGPWARGSHRLTSRLATQDFTKGYEQLAEQAASERVLGGAPCHFA
jgi:hypothetical protein